MEDKELSLSDQGKDNAIALISRIAVTGDYTTSTDEKILLIMYYHAAVSGKLTTSLSRSDLQYIEFSLDIVRKALGDTKLLDKAVWRQFGKNRGGET